MSKQFRGMRCIYCGVSQSTTGDHVFARAFFPPDRRGSLPKVPSCGSCNNDKSKLEHYLASVIPFGGRHADALTNLQTIVPGRLAKNMKLHRQLSEGRTEVLTEEPPGVRVKAVALPFDSDQLHRLFGYIVKGLLWHHWSIELLDQHDVKVISATAAGEAFFRGIVDGRAQKRVTGDVGEGAFCYEGAQGVDDSRFSVWVFRVFGGLTLTDDPAAPSEELRGVVAVTASKQFFQRPAIASLLS